MSGNPIALKDMIANMSHGGKIAILGIPSKEMPMDWRQVIFNMLTIKGIYGREMYDTWYKMSVMIESGLDISPVITHRFALNELYEQGFDAMISGANRQSRSRSHRLELSLKVRSTQCISYIREPSRQSKLKDIEICRADQARTYHHSGHSSLRSQSAAAHLCSTSAPITIWVSPIIPPSLTQPAKALDNWGYGLASVRFICGTQSIHKQCEVAIAKFFGKQDSILYISCFDANGGLFEPLLGEQDAILSDELNHASIIDGVRLCKAQRFRYKHNDMADLKSKLEESKNCRFRMIFTDSVFSMDGDLAKLPDICALADEYDAIVGIDDCHGTGHLGGTGRGAAEELGVLDRIDVITSTLGKTLGGASGGFTVASAEVVDWLKNRSRPYLFSNSVPPSLVAAGMKALEVIDSSGDLRERCQANTVRMRAGLEAAGFTVKPGPTPILPVMLFDASLATNMANELLLMGIYVIGFSFPVVPNGQARIRLQVSAAHSTEQIDEAIAAFKVAGKKVGALQ